MICSSNTSSIGCAEGLCSTAGYCDGMMLGKSDGMSDGLLDDDAVGGVVVRIDGCIEGKSDGISEIEGM